VLCRPRRKREAVARPSVDEVVVPDVFPEFVIVVGGAVVIFKRDHRANTLDIH
jgi:hypothetical protein